MIINRIYYKGRHLHLGHLQVLYHNNDFAQLNGGKCYAIIDDRYSDITVLYSIFDYLMLKSIVIVPLTTLQHKLTNMLANDNKVYLCKNNKVIKNRSIINSQILSPCYHFQIKGDGDILLGYTKSDTVDNSMRITYIFDHILPYIDRLLEVTDICTSSDLTGTPVRTHKIETYYIRGFDINNRKWSLDSLKSSNIPASLLYEFYKLGCAKKVIDIGLLHINEVYGIVNPLKIELSNWNVKRIEYIFDGSEFKPLEKTVFVEQEDIKQSDSVINLKHGLYINKNREYGEAGEEGEGREDGEDGEETRWISGNVIQVYFFIGTSRVSLGYIQDTGRQLYVIHLKEYGHFIKIGYICSIPVFKMI